MLFCKLGFHSEYTVGKSSIKIDDLKKYLVGNFAICDNANISSLIKSLKINDKNIPSVELFVTHDYNSKNQSFNKIRLFCYDMQAYQSMCKMIDIANQHMYYTPRISLNDLIFEGDIRIIIDSDFEFLDYLPYNKTYIAVNEKSNLSNPIYIKYNCIFYYDSYAIKEKDRFKIKLLAGAKQSLDPSLISYFENPNHYKTAILIQNSIDNYHKFLNDAKPFLTFENKYPIFCENSEKYFDVLVNSGFQRKIKDGGELYWRRLDYEIEVIKKMGFCDYFLIIWDFIYWAKKNNIPIGPGRGSAAGSLVSYCLDITKLDPIQNGLYFERFLNPERISPPDIDIDIDADDRQKVVDYIKNRYGNDKVSQIITFGLLKSKSAFKDSCRYFNIEAEEANRITSYFPQAKFGIPPTLEEAEAISNVKEWIEESEGNKEVWNSAKYIENFVRQTGVHAAGVVISPTELNITTGISYKDNQKLCQLDKEDTEKFGLLKMDFLGLNTLSFIKKICAKLGMSYYDMENIPLNDPKVFEAFTMGDTHGIFQFESPKMKELLKKIKPTKFADIAATTAIYRPGPLMAGLADLYVKNKNAEMPEYFIPEFETLLDETYGVFIYQEQVMKIAQEICGFTLSKADGLRKAIGKKKKDEMAKFKEEFINGALINNFDYKIINELWNQILGFADYCFNKSHSYTYALLSYWSMYLKVNHSKEFIITLLSTDMKDNTKMQNNFFEFQDKFKFLPPSINNSKEDFSVKEDKIYIGFGCISSVGNLAKNLEKNQPYTSIIDIAIKNNLDKTSFLNLVYSGALDEFEPNRRVLVGNYERILNYAKNNKNSNFINFFDPQDTFSLNYSSISPLLDDELMEREAYGYHIFNGFINKNSWYLKYLDSNTIIGNIREIKYTKTKKRNEDMAILSVDTSMGKMQIPIFPKYYESLRSELFKDRTYAFYGDLESKINDDGEEEKNFIAKDVVESRGIKIKKIEIYSSLSYTRQEFENFINNNIIDSGSTKLELNIPIENGMVDIYTFPKKINYTKNLHNTLIENKNDIKIHIFDY